MTKYNFGEKEMEYSAKDNAELRVWMSPKYIQSKNKAIEMIESGNYKGLDESYFWILMNRTKSKKMAYTGLIISHDGMKVVNNSLPEDKKVKAKCFSSPKMSEYKENCMFMEYMDDDTYEIGEISLDNCSNAYPYAMLLKRTYDRVVRDKAQMYGIYSEAEADEFRQDIDEPNDVRLYDYFKSLYKEEEVNKILAHYQKEKVEDLDLKIIAQYINSRKNK